MQRSWREKFHRFTMRSVVYIVIGVLFLASYFSTTIAFYLSLVVGIFFTTEGILMLILRNTK